MTYIYGPRMVRVKQKYYDALNTIINKTIEPTIISTIIFQHSAMQESLLMHVFKISNSCVRTFTLNINKKYFFLNQN